MIQNFGRKALNEVRTALAELGLSLKIKSKMTFKGLTALKPEEFFNVSIEELNLSGRCRNSLWDADIKTIGDLIQKTEDELLIIQNFGRKALNEVRTALAELGLSLGMNRAVLSLDDKDAAAMGKSQKEDEQKPTLFSEEVTLVKMLGVVETTTKHMERLQYDDPTQTMGVRDATVTPWGQRLYPVILSMLSFMLIKQLQEEFGADFVRDGYVFGSVATDEAAQYSDADMYIQFSELSEQCMRVRDRLFELERILLQKLSEAGVKGISRIVDRQVSMIRQVPTPGDKNIKNLVNEKLIQWIKHESRTNVRELLSQYCKNYLAALSAEEEKPDSGAIGKFVEHENFPVEGDAEGKVTGVLENIETGEDIILKQVKQRRAPPELVHSLLGKVEQHIINANLTRQESALLFSIINRFKREIPDYIILTQAGGKGLFGFAKPNILVIDQEIIHNPLSFLHEIVEYVNHIDPTVVKQMEQLLNESGKEWLSIHEEKYKALKRHDYFMNNRAHFVMRAFTRQVFKEKDVAFTDEIKEGIFLTDEEREEFALYEKKGYIEASELNGERVYLVPNSEESLNEAPLYDTGSNKKETLEMARQVGLPNVDIREIKHFGMLYAWLEMKGTAAANTLIEIIKEIEEGDVTALDKIKGKGNLLPEVKKKVKEILLKKQYDLPLADQLAFLKTTTDYNDITPYIERFLKEKKDALYPINEKTGRADGIIQLDSDKPYLIIPDLHARREQLVELLFTSLEKVIAEDNRAYYAAWFTEQDFQKTILELLSERKIQVIQLGDLMHSEKKEVWNSGTGIFPHELVKGNFNVLKDETPRMDKEMTDGLGVAAIVMLLKQTFPDNFHILKGNHDNINNVYNKETDSLDETAETFDKETGNSFVMKGWALLTQTGKLWGDKRLGTDFMNAYAEWENRLPIFAIGKNFTASHSEPADTHQKEEINERTGRIVYNFTWARKEDEKKRRIFGTHVIPVLQNIFQAAWGKKAHISGHDTIGINDGIKDMVDDKRLLIVNHKEQLTALFVKPTDIFNKDAWEKIVIPTPEKTHISAERRTLLGDESGFANLGAMTLMRVLMGLGLIAFKKPLLLVGIIGIVCISVIRVRTVSKGSVKIVSQFDTEKEQNSDVIVFRKTKDRRKGDILMYITSLKEGDELKVANVWGAGEHMQYRTISHATVLICRGKIEKEDGTVEEVYSTVYVDPQNYEDELESVRTEFEERNIRITYLGICPTMDNEKNELQNRRIVKAAINTIKPTYTIHFPNILGFTATVTPAQIDFYVKSRFGADEWKTIPWKRFEGVWYKRWLKKLREIFSRKQSNPALLETDTHSPRATTSRENDKRKSPGNNLRKLFVPPIPDAELEQMIAADGVITVDKDTFEDVLSRQKRYNEILQLIKPSIDTYQDINFVILTHDDMRFRDGLILDQGFIDKKGQKNIVLHSNVLQNAQQYDSGRIDRDGAYIINELVIPHVIRDIERDAHVDDISLAEFQRVKDFWFNHIAEQRADETLHINEQLIDPYVYQKLKKDEKLIIVCKEDEYRRFHKAVEPILMQFAPYVDFRLVENKKYEKELSTLVENGEVDQTIILVPTEEALVTPSPLEMQFQRLILKPSSAKHFIVFISILKALVAMINADDQVNTLKLVGDFITPERNILRIDDEKIAGLISEALEKHVKQRMIAIAA
ncbi:MAG: hypothetical protein KKH94_06810 [Candidatus Omnitrophica bacterium]|nr:hypothetical protein [Candidatus Omnitrophota bacterium]